LVKEQPFPALLVLHLIPSRHIFLGHITDDTPRLRSMV
jgi:hypothetical protein